MLLDNWFCLESVDLGSVIHVYGLNSLIIFNKKISEQQSVIMLNKNFPNPFNPTTKIEFGIEEGEGGTLTIYNVLGQKVLFQQFEAGFYTFTWDATKQASGIYFYRLRTPSYHKENKMIMLK